MLIYEAIELNIDEKEMISFVGGGGKTTTIFQLAKELILLGKKVLISTTTKIGVPLKDQYDYLFLKDLKHNFNPQNSTITILGEEIKGKKLIGISPERLDEIFTRNIFDIILIEADGANRKTIKAPASHEPVVPISSTKTIGVIGLDSLGKSIDKNNVHRAEILSAISEKALLDIIDEETIIKLVLDKNGLFKNTYGNKILLLNKADDEIKILRGTKIKKVLKDNGFKDVIISNIKKKEFF
ncbi:selenium cofactor biosynthesis protein YqeC [Tissierella praeacuta]|uniref:selenium cofactor biosynthesis protein YqeC n=1 Tax=Tissierella praeacuta TaxID=43131 RepID=UPI003DA4525C